MEVHKHIISFIAFAAFTVTTVEAADLESEIKGNFCTPLLLAVRLLEPHDIPVSSAASAKVELALLTEERMISTIREIQSQFIYDKAGKAWRKIPENFQYLAKETYAKKDVFNRYWVLIDKATDRVIGGAGIYKPSWWKKDVWLNWFFVRPEFRGSGYGKLLLQRMIHEAKAVGAKKFRVYTSDRPREFDPRIMYRKLGMRQTDQKPEIFDGKPTGANTVFFEMDLK